MQNLSGDVREFVSNLLLNNGISLDFTAFPTLNFPAKTRFSASFELVFFYSQMELLYEEEYQWLWEDKHICHYHVNDYAGAHKEWGKLRTLPIGQGHVEFDRFFDFINKIGYKGTFTVEATAFDSNGVIDIDMLNKQFDYIRNAID